MARKNLSSWMQEKKMRRKVNTWGLSEGTLRWRTLCENQNNVRLWMITTERCKKTISLDLASMHI